MPQVFPVSPWDELDHAIGAAFETSKEMRGWPGSRFAEFLEAYATEIKLKTRLFVLYQELQHFRHISAALEQRIITLLERALTETRKAYQLGKYSYLELSALQQEVLDARLAVIDAGFSSQLNTIEIERLTGQSLPASSEEKQ